MIDRRRRKAVHPTPAARGLQLIAGVTVLLGILLVGADPVGAHEIAVAMVIATDEDSDIDSVAVVDGLRLAIDQSPDVGHAAGSDAGDHLGGVDVALTVLDGMETPAEVGDAARRAVADGASVVVALGDSASLAAAAEGVAAGSGFLLAVLAGPGEVDAALTMPILRPVGTADTEAASAFSASFEAAFERSPSESAALGYDIGQLLDVLFEETSGSIPDTSSLENVSEAVQTRLTSTSLDGVEETEAISRTASDGGGGPNPTAPRVVVGAGLAAGLIATLVWWQQRRREG